MILYKYRSLTNFEHVLDIILKQRLHCAPYGELNDPFEGLFKEIIDLYPHLYPQIRQRSPSLLGSLFGGLCKVKGPITVDKTVKDLTEEDLKICSLSASLSDVRLWSYYADGHKGIAIEIDFSDLEDLESKIFEVKYEENLFSTDSTKFNWLRGEPKPQEILSHKTKHWEYEAEYRIIQKDKDFYITNRLKKIYLGTRISEADRVLLTKVVPKEVLIYGTKINKEKIEVEEVK